MPQDTLDNDVPSLVRKLQHGSRAALARVLTLAAADREVASLASALQCVSKEYPAVIAVTGSGGVGKSSLLGAVAMHFAERDERIGVLACDPESPISRGALLGDRCRIAGASTTERIFIRSLATASGRQGIAQNTELMLAAIKAYGFDRIFVETVGAGQGDVAVRRVADHVVLVLQPQAGDELQWEKAGILEIADVVVVNKSDLPGADKTVAEVTRQLQATNAPAVPVIRTSVARGDGLQELCRVIESAPVSPMKFSIAQYDNS